MGENAYLDVNVLSFARWISDLKRTQREADEEVVSRFFETIVPKARRCIPRTKFTQHPPQMTELHRVRDLIARNHAEIREFADDARKLDESENRQLADLEARFAAAVTRIKRFREDCAQGKLRLENLHEIP